MALTFRPTSCCDWSAVRGEREVSGLNFSLSLFLFCNNCYVVLSQHMLFTEVCHLVCIIWNASVVLHEFLQLVCLSNWWSCFTFVHSVHQTVIHTETNFILPLSWVLLIKQLIICYSRHFDNFVIKVSHSQFFATGPAHSWFTDKSPQSTSSQPSHNKS